MRIFEVIILTCATKLLKDWLKGNLKYGFAQTSGTPKTMRYDFYYKKGSSNWNRLKNDGYAVKNSIYQEEYSGHASNGTSKYSHKLIRDKYPSGKLQK